MLLSLPPCLPPACPAPVVQEKALEVRRRQGRHVLFTQPDEVEVGPQLPKHTPSGRSTLLCQLHRVPFDCTARAGACQGPNATPDLSQRA